MTQLLEPIIDEVGILSDQNDESKLNDEDTLSLFINSRTSIRTAGTAQLNTCGFLLTLSLGAIYFMFGNGQSAGIHLNWIFKPALVGAAMLLASSIVTELIAIHAKPIHTIDKLQLINNENTNSSIETAWARVSVVLLVLAVICLVAAFLTFMDDCSHIDNSSNATVSKENQFIITITPSEFQKLKGLSLNTTLKGSSYQKI